MSKNDALCFYALLKILAFFCHIPFITTFVNIIKCAVFATVIQLLLRQGGFPELKTRIILSRMLKFIYILNCYYPHNLTFLMMIFLFLVNAKCLSKIIWCMWLIAPGVWLYAPSVGTQFQKHTWKNIDKNNIHLVRIIKLLQIKISLFFKGVLIIYIQNYERIY